MVKARKLVPIAAIVALVFSLGIMLPVAQPVSAAVGVLFETGHQTKASNMPGYNNMITDLTSRGFSFIEDNDGDITEADLSGNSILVIVEPDVALSASEIVNIQSFIAAGNGLLLMSYNLEASGRTPVNTLLSPYNLQQSSVLKTPGIYTDITSHAITTGVSQYDQESQGGKFTIVGSPALSLIRDEAGDTLVAASYVGGRIVVVSDETAFHQNSYNNPDNNILMRNIFDWLTDIEPPVADFSAQSRTGEGLLNARFIDGSTGNIDTWQWDFGDGTTSNEQNPTHVYDQPGKYTVSLEVTGARGSDTEVKQSYISVTDVSGRVAEAEPAKFSTSYANIEPTQVVPDQVVSISLDVANSGSTRGSYEVVLNINGKLEDSRIIDVSPGSSKTVVFNMSKTTPGTYEVSIDGHKGQFIVIESPPGTPSSVTTGGPGTPAIIAIIAGTVGTVVAIIFIFRHRRRAVTLEDIEEKYRKLLDLLK